MICVSVGRKGYEACARAVSGLAFAEVRLDKAGLTVEETKRLFAAHPNLIATFRPGAAVAAERRQCLLAAIHAGAAYVDVELGAPEAYRKRLVGAARDYRRTVIVSHHDHDGTPGEAELRAIVRRCLEMRPDLVKIACKVNGERDGARLLGLLDTSAKLVVVGMGPLGRTVRIAAPLLGSPFTYASREEGKETADGQMTGDEMRRIYKAMEAERR